MLPVLLGLTAAVILGGCAVSAPPSPPLPEPEPDPPLPGRDLTPAANTYYHQLTAHGLSSSHMDRGYFIGPWPGRFVAPRETIKGREDGFVDGLEVYLAALDFADADPADEFLQSLMQAMISDPMSRLEFAQTLIHSPERREERLGMAEQLLNWSIREDGESTYLWMQLGAVQERRGELTEADESYHHALRHCGREENLAILRMLANVQRSMGRSGMARYYESLARDLATRQPSP